MGVRSHKKTPELPEQPQGFEIELRRDEPLSGRPTQPRPGAVYNLCDDDPAPPQDVLAYAAELLGLPLPPEVDFDAADMTPMARSFYAENKRVRNDLIKSELGVRLKYPSYKEGLQSLLTLETPQS